MLSTALEDIGVNMQTVEMRRGLTMAFEKVLDMDEKLSFPHKTTAFIFGSQSEGTTTPDLESDFDTMFCLDYWNVILYWTTGNMMFKMH
ncbi:hypothetical protein DPMN_034959 [Dreissena polymorpha]|uniref:Uncharacterized protein n=1 Tax=Dreissena polymorpha TaxID=45954 RepID=A0A9D4M8T2_DREPO|nr:hypothetical protein DPMN_034959 [Dreissena polymorpha]